MPGRTSSQVARCSSHDSDSPFLTHEDTEDAIPLYIQGNSFYLKMLGMRTVPMTTNLNDVIVAPVLGRGDAEAWEQAGMNESADEEAPIPEVEETDRQVESRMCLTMENTVREMPARLKILGYAVHGDKAAVFKRLKKAEKDEAKRVEKERQKEAEVQARHEDLIQGERQVKAPGQPTEKERSRCNLTHMT